MPVLCTKKIVEKKREFYWSRAKFGLSPAWQPFAMMLEISPWKQLTFVRLYIETENCLESDDFNLIPNIIVKWHLKYMQKCVYLENITCLKVWFLWQKVCLTGVGSRQTEAQKWAINPPLDLSWGNSISPYSDHFAHWERFMHSENLRWQRI